MENEDIIDLLFSKKNEECLFNLDDEVLNDFNSNVEIAQDKLEHFANKRVHPRNKQILKQFIKDYQSARTNQQIRENQLYYKNGVVDGVNLVMLLTTFE